MPLAALSVTWRCRPAEATPAAGRVSWVGVAAGRGAADRGLLAAERAVDAARRALRHVALQAGEVDAGGGADHLVQDAVVERAQRAAGAGGQRSAGGRAQP